MAGSMNFEFDCPQFYDFCNGVEENNIDIHSLGGDSPGFENFNLRSKNLMKNRFAAWNNKLSTPVNKSPFVNTRCLNNATDSEKLTADKKRLSKSDSSVNIVGAHSNVSKKALLIPGLACKRSLSEADTRPKKKFPATPRKLPATPMCLKRAQRKDKSKKLKTTEEMELDKIAELQRLTLKHLKFNEQNLKRMKMKPKPPSVPKIAPLKEEKREKSEAVKEFQKDLKSVVKRLNSNRNMRFISNPVKRTDRLGAVSSEDDVELPGPSQIFRPHLSSVLNEVQVSMGENDIINELSFKKYPGHSGLFFDMNNTKKAALKPFNFHDRAKDSVPETLSKSSVNINKENERMKKVPFSHSFHTSHLGNRNKENNFSIKTAPKTDAGIRKKSFKF